MTKPKKNPSLRYDEGCLAAHALNLIGDRWALLVVRELMFTAKRFQMIRSGIPGITASVLTGRLAQLIQAGVIKHEERLSIYTLTEEGKALLPVLEELCRWALKVPGHDPSRFISPTALMISMGVNLIAERAGSLKASAGFDFDTEAFEMTLCDGLLTTKAVSKAQTPFVIKGNGNQQAAAVYGPAPLSALISKGVVEVTGDIDEAQTFLSLFELQKSHSAPSKNDR